MIKRKIREEIRNNINSNGPSECRSRSCRINSINNKTKVRRAFFLIRLSHFWFHLSISFKVHLIDIMRHSNVQTLATRSKWRPQLRRASCVLDVSDVCVTGPNRTAVCRSTFSAQARELNGNGIQHIYAINQISLKLNVPECVHRFHLLPFERQPIVEKKKVPSRKHARTVNYKYLQSMRRRIGNPLIDFDKERKGVRNTKGKRNDGEKKCAPPNSRVLSFANDFSA